jgi:hypothetical protein
MRTDQITISLYKVWTQASLILHIGVDTEVKTSTVVWC